jgi:hypothetical protein
MCPTRFYWRNSRWDGALIVIARFSRSKAGYRLAIAYLLIGLFFLATLYHPSGADLFTYIKSKGEFWLYVIPVGWRWLGLRF